MEAQFRRTPHKWNDDIRFFRVGMLQGFLGHELGLRYIDEQKHATAVRYADPSDLFLNGLIDTKQGTCGNMPVLHVAMARRMGWPVSLACAKSHQISRFDDGEVVYNIEATSTRPGSFCSDPDEVYIERYNLPAKAIECGSDLRKLTAREMVGVFLGYRLALLTIFIGSVAGGIAGLLLARRSAAGLKTSVPFGVFLSPAAIAALLWGDLLIGAYLGLVK
jgi:hypothetical protein